MSIKRSLLESKWYYRVAKVIFLWVPPILVAFILFSMFYSGFSSNTVLDFVYMAIGLAVYYLLLKGIWRGFLYVVFGGLEDDTKKKNPAIQVVQSAGSATQPVQAPNQAGPIFGAIFFIIIIIFIAIYSSNNYFPGNSIFSDSNTYGTACTSDGKKGLYGTNGNCLTCPGGGIAATSPVNNCSDGIAGVYCCTSGGSKGVNGGDGGSKGCFTGCAGQYYCNGYYYFGLERVTINGCVPFYPRDVYSDWAGTCRRCL